MVGRAWSLEEILSSRAFAKMKEEVFGNGEIDAITRPGSVIVRLRVEHTGLVKRIILLRPNGFTAERVEELSAHPEARWARIKVNGGIRGYSENFIPLKKAVRFCYYDNASAKTLEATPYALRDHSSKHYFEKEKSSRSVFLAVKRNGYGFHHSILNQTDEWILLVLEKQLHDRKGMRIAEKIAAARKSNQEALSLLLDVMPRFGSNTFSIASGVVETTVAMAPDETLPVLLDALNLPERGNHEPCTAFGMILKIAKRNPELATQHIEDAIKNKAAPDYYLRDLLQKVGKF